MPKPKRRPLEGGSTVRVTVYLTMAEYLRLVALCERMDVTQSEFLRRALENA